MGSMNDSDSLDFDRMKQVMFLSSLSISSASLFTSFLSNVSFHCQEILEEVVRELHKVKDEIIDGTFINQHHKPLL